MVDMYNPAHPGELLDDYLNGVSIAEAARRMGITRATLSRIRNGHAAITADMALRLSELLGTSAEVWLNMQMAHDLWVARNRSRPHVQPLVPSDFPTFAVSASARPITLASVNGHRDLFVTPVSSSRTPQDIDEQIELEPEAWD
jgi:antitoxin HigA-1